jgi:hypothetical protein
MVRSPWAHAPQADRDPDRYWAFDLLWKYKWVVDSLKEFPQIPRAKVHEMLEDLGRRYRQIGSGMRPVFQLYFTLAQDMGDRKEAARYYLKWQASPRDPFLADCEACQLHRQVSYLVFRGQDEQALEQGAPIFQGRMRCTEVPAGTYATVLLPLVRLGRVREAVAYHHKGYRLIAGNRNYLAEAAWHLRFLVLTDNLARAVKLFDKHLAWTVDNFELTGVFEFYLAALFLLGRLADTGKTALKLRLPCSFPGYQESGKNEVGPLADWFEKEARAMAARFDQRNGNDFFSRRLGKPRRLKKWLAPFPLNPPG